MPNDVELPNLGFFKEEKGEGKGSTLSKQRKKKFKVADWNTLYND